MIGNSESVFNSNNRDSRELDSNDGIQARRIEFLERMQAEKQQREESEAEFRRTQKEAKEERYRQLQLFRTDKPASFEFVDIDPNEISPITETGVTCCPAADCRCRAIEIEDFKELDREAGLLTQYFRCSRKHIFRHVYKRHGGGIVFRPQVQQVVGDVGEGCR